MQAGIKNITLYENKNIEFNFHDADNSNNISNITTQGSVIEILNNQLPEFEIKSMLGGSGDVLFEYLVKLFIYEYTIDNISLISALKKSIYGWCPLIEYYDGTIKFYNSPLWLNESELKPQSEVKDAKDAFVAIASAAQGLTSMITAGHDTIPPPPDPPKPPK